MKFTQEYIEELVRLGALKKVGVDEDGDDILFVTNKCKQLAPELYTYRTEFIGLAAIGLWQQDFAVVYIEDNIFKLELTDKAFDPIAINGLTEELQQAIKHFRLIIDGGL